MTAQISFTGNATADADLKFTPSGAAVANFTVAVTPRVKNPDGSWGDGDAAFYRVAAWKHMAENVAASIQKGTRVTITGQLKPRPFEHNGQQRLSLDVTADSVALDVRFAPAAHGQSQGGGFAQQPATASWGQPASAQSWGQPAEAPF